ncbi:hypothetical protein SARC_09969 [Sphaeroforma arctica JP610]|uniref:Calmodulin-lysine N-methyltransferase n=1 Tax=Sphaeroforma arctica JP610 TaxID=667725 RepID=A0A0L0FM78_9EUKA|nr:hypothetical protein SARC_09969 [Sphaeroforma arctica JP610]KNC77566.1 hypothetical protein SARC_09969 [Sphaeroforma arctica JP610]|eukprot:XP_014151468.1 hypothetical protein SARC_09969 [Sphaeroforma arctica JP610]
MTACLFGKPKQYSFTDRSAVVLSTLAKNLKLNAVNYTAAELPSDTQDEKTSADDSHVTAVRTPVANLRFLDWVEASNDEIAEYDADLFLAADVVFDPVIIEPLVRVISVLLRKSSCYGIISCTIRNPETFELFIKSLDSADVHIETLDHTPSNIYFYDRIAEVRILRLTKSRVH